MYPDVAEDTESVMSSCPSLSTANGSLYKRRIQVLQYNRDNNKNRGKVQTFVFSYIRTTTYMLRVKA